jgi:RNA polymerase sigma-70 factor (ECF subfamily)
MDDSHSQLPADALHHLDGLYNLARWLTRDPVEAEDLVQDTYLRALRGARQFEVGTNLRAWLFQIMRNAFFTQYRKRGREAETMDPDVLDAMASRQDEAGGTTRRSAHSHGALSADLAAALERLPEEYRSVVLLADVEDFTMTEVAEIMGCPVGTVKSRLFRARAILKDLLRDYVR